MSLLDKYLYGWDEIEPVIVGCVANNLNFLLTGKHGAGKSTLARLISAALKADDKFKFVKYSMDKENLLSMVGCPNPEALKKGQLEYAQHERSVFNADVIMMDEITRANKDTQNLVLEILEERTIFGMPLRYKFAIGTCNDQTYKGAYRLDDALLDRFVATIPVPCAQEGKYSSEDYLNMITVNQSRLDSESMKKADEELRNAVSEIRSCTLKLLKNRSLMNRINMFCAKFYDGLTQSMTKSKTPLPVSTRQIAAQTPFLIISLAAYYKVMQHEEYIYEGTKKALEASLVYKLAIPGATIDVIINPLKDLLSSNLDDDAIARSCMNSGPLKDRINSFKKYSTIFNQFEIAEQMTIVGDIIQTILADVKTKASKESRQAAYADMAVLWESIGSVSNNSIKDTVFAELAALKIALL